MVSITRKRSYMGVDYTYSQWTAFKNSVKTPQDKLEAHAAT